jgi:DNA-binding transcriptional regulator YdaS (Cro superfamily)
MNDTAITRAVEKAGGQTALARAINVSQGLVWQWLNGAPIHIKHFESIERATGITYQELLAGEMQKLAEKAATSKEKAA